MESLERLCPQTWWQWAVYGLLAVLLLLNVAASNMQAPDARANTAVPPPHAAAPGVR